MKKLKEKLNAKLSKNGGFTLVEMLIVVAIIAILIAVSIPLISASLDEAKEGVDQANARSAQSMAVAYYLTHYEALKDETSVDLYYYIDPTSHEGQIKKEASAPTAGSPGYNYGAIGTGKGGFVTVTMDGSGNITATTWTGKP